MNSALAGTLGLSVTVAAAVGPKKTPSGVVFAEPERDIPLIEDCDVIVCGAGPAGVSAAIAAARSGTRVRLFDTHGCLGGVWTAGLLTWIFDFEKPELTKEIREQLEQRGARRGTNTKDFVYEPDDIRVARRG